MESLTFQRHEHVDDPRSLWRVDRVDAFNADGDKVGYLKISYVPKARIAHWQQDPYHFLADRGSGLGFYAPRDLTQAEQPRLADLATSLHTEFEGMRASGNARWHEQSGEAILAQLRAWRPQVQALVDRPMREFIDFHVDRPLVDFVEVGEGFRGQRLSRWLYREAAEWMSERGLQLHASGAQRPAAARMWEVMGQEGLVEAAPGSPDRRVLRTGPRP